LIAVALAIFGATRWVGNSYAFFAPTRVQYIVLGTAWNIPGAVTPAT